ncbi:Protein-tyrosine-phosphatase-like protein [Thioalkalivibrio sulfidiphilus HL-EbGr7]|uniref:protein-tyrosine-phosphatase n=1 Tax=Thioalkalivibrio sulfidiphilus (strain HL-EbGR7) TaxID=396588 RepID=B8GVB3_THISH|nr:Protein-tyrosine-phosphatase-like protein [Thioalkalivibrio sulfidiphilus HL-EbGr7]
MGLLQKVQLRFATYRALRSARCQTLERAAQLGFRRILVMCYGNIYRSPLVAAYLRRSLSGQDGIEIRSAGFHPKPGRRSPDDYVGHVRCLTGLDLSQHKSRVIEQSDLEWADSIVIMDRHNWHAITGLGRVYEAKVVWLGAFLPGGPLEVDDPYGQDVQRVLELVGMAVRAAESMSAKILDAVSESSQKIH